MSGFKTLVATMEQVAENKPHTVTGITGYGGSGKSHLANKQRNHFDFNDNQVTRIDNLYGLNPKGSNIFDQSDWNLLSNLLQKSNAGKRIKYQGKDHKGNI